MEKIKIFACSKEAEPFTREICEYLDVPMGKIERMKFKNDNNFVQILETVRDYDVYLIQSNTPPVNERIMELLITIDAVKRASARNINVVLPYYIYSRSDKKDQPRVPITAKLLAELIEAAGGITSRAQVKAINRAVLLKDQDKIYIPYKGEKVESAVTTPNTNSGNNDSANSSNKASGDKVNLNTANITELQKLTGIGEKKAEQIIAYREQNGSFQKIEDLMQVSGIGEKTFASLKDQLAI